jgi:putative ABC transport system permease protein
MASIARKNLLEDIPRFLVAQAGILFAVSLVTIQTGIQYGFARSASLLIDQSQADIWVSSKNMEHVGLTVSIPYEGVAEASKIEGVEKAEGVIIRGALWYEQEADSITSVTVVGAEPEGLLFEPSNIAEGSFNDLKEPYRFIIDRTSLKSIRLENIGEVGEINNTPAKLVGLTQGTQSIIFANMMFTSLENANNFINYGSRTAPSESNPASSISATPRKITSKDAISFVLIRAQPGANLEQLKQDLEESLPDTRAYTKMEMSQITRDFWQVRSGIGFILGLGAIVGVVVGAVVVSQILYASVTDHIKEFGTLKAMGASDWFVYGVIIEQSLWMAILGYIPGIALCLGVAAWASTTQGILILITPLTAATVFGITVVMCVSSAIFAIQKVTRLDPAIVFKG